MNALNAITAAFMQAHSDVRLLSGHTKHGKSIKISRPFGNSKKSQRYRDWQMSVRQGNEIAREKSDSRLRMELAKIA